MACCVVCHGLLTSCRAISYWEADSGIVTEVEEADENAMDGVDEDDE